MDPLAVSADQARRFLVTRHLLAPPRALPAEPASVMAVIDRLGLLQFDPLEVPGARNHDLVLHARIGGYQRAWCEEYLYGPDRRLIELYNKSLNIVPIDELPHYRVTWERNRADVEGGILTEQRAVADAVLARLEADGPLTTAAFAEHAHAIDWWWAPTRASRAVMEALFVIGRIGIARREGNRRHYDLIERIVPAKLLADPASEEEAMTHRLLSRFRAMGITAPNGVQMEVMYSAGPPADRRRRTDRLVDDGVLAPIQVEGMKSVSYVLADELPMLRDAVAPLAATGVSFLAPLDPIVWDRRLLRDLWGFDYLWEVYVPEKKRKWGYYVLPILFGDRFVGRIEPRLDRKTKTLRILGVWFEPDFDPAGDPAFATALTRAVEDYRRFVGAEKVAWPRTRVGRSVANLVRDR
ncbi:MAG: winged helix DNA-binding domain-containing protein [Chloroflexi bacterium]|nr:winged helix DNA-binding domain-containing protein [Chloroflexota bacterium]